MKWLILVFLEPFLVALPLLLLMELGGRQAREAAGSIYTVNLLLSCVPAITCAVMLARRLPTGQAAQVLFGGIFFALLQCFYLFSLVAGCASVAGMGNMK